MQEALQAISHIFTATPQDVREVYNKCCQADSYFTGDDIEGVHFTNSEVESMLPLFTLYNMLDAYADVGEGAFVVPEPLDKDTIENSEKVKNIIYETK